MTESTPLEPPADLTALADTAIKNLKKAYAPYSNFQVSAAARVRDSNGAIHVIGGVNVENMINRMSVCAETSLISNIYSTLGPGFVIEEIIVVNKARELVAPCGACRATIHEHTHHTGEDFFVNGGSFFKLYPDAPKIVIT